LQPEHEVVDNQGYFGKYYGKKFMGNQDPLNSHCTGHAFLCYAHFELSLKALCIINTIFITKGVAYHEK